MFTGSTQLKSLQRMESSVQDRVKRLQAEMQLETCRQKNITLKLRKKTRELNNRQEGRLPPAKTILSRTVSYQQRRKLKLPVINSAWSNKYNVGRADWDDDIRVILTSVVNQIRVKPLTKRQETVLNAVLKLQQWYRRIRFLRLWKDTTSSVVLLKKLHMNPLKAPVASAPTISAEQVIERIERDADIEIARRKQYEAASLIQERYRKRISIHASPEMKAARILHRREARRHYALDMIEREKAAVRIQALLRGRKGRKKLDLSTSVTVRRHLQFILRREEDLAKSPQNTTIITDLSSKYLELSAMDVYESERYRMVRLAAVLGENALLLGYEPVGGLFWVQLAQALYYLWNQERDGFILRRCGECFDQCISDLAVCSTALVWQQYGDVLYHRGLLFGAIQVFEKYLQFTSKATKKNIDEARFIIVQCKLSLLDFASATRDLISLLNQDAFPEAYSKVDVLVLLGRCYQLQFERELAMQKYQEAFELVFTKKKIARLNLPIGHWLETRELWRTLAEKCQRNRHYPFAIECFSQALGYSEQSQRAECFAKVANCYHGLSNEAKSLEYISQAVKLNPTSPLVTQVAKEITDSRSSQFERDIFIPVIQLRGYFRIIL